MSQPDELSLQDAVRSFQQVARRWNAIVQGMGVVLGGFVAPLILWQIGVKGKEFWAYPLPVLLILTGIFLSEPIAFFLTKRRFKGDARYADIVRFGSYRVVQADPDTVAEQLEQAKLR